jgi:hypothetical protein
MARRIVITVPPSSATALYPTSVAGGVATSSIPLATSYPVVFPNLQKNITLSSTDNLSAVNFTITGQDIYLNTISEVLAGPNNTTVTSGKQYNTIFSIAASGAYTNFSIGTGTTALSSNIVLNTMSSYPSFSLSVTVAGAITYSIYEALDEVQSYQPVGPYYQYLKPTPINLGNNSLATTSASSTVTVTIPTTAGLKSGNIVSIQNATATGGISFFNLNVTSEITVTSGTTFTYSATTNATSAATGGGNNASYYSPSLPVVYQIASALTGATTSQFFAFSEPVASLQMLVSASTAPASLVLTILQQGLK